MSAPACLKCGLTDSMVAEDSGPTYESWKCLRCNVSRSQKNELGKALPFVGPVIALALAVIGIPWPGPDDSGFGF